MEDRRAQAALVYAQKYGFAVFPLHSVRDGRCTCGNAKCDRKGKHPRTQGGLKDASKDPQVITRWWRRWPDANVGIATGAVSGFWVLDIDTAGGKAGEDSLDYLQDELGPLPATWEQITGSGGRHMLFRYPGIPIKNKVGWMEGLDVRGDGGYIVAPPSVHASGRTYEWELEHHPAEIPMAMAPELWVSALTEPKQSTGQAVDLPDKFAAGQRNELMFRLGASLRARGLSAAALRAALHEENRARCTPPLSDHEVDTIAESCAKYAPGEPRPAAAAMERSALDTRLRDVTPEEIFGAEIIGALAAVKDENAADYAQYKLQIRDRFGRAVSMRDLDSAVKQAQAKRRNFRIVNGNETDPLASDLIKDCPLKVRIPRDWRWDLTGVRRVVPKNNGPDELQVASQVPVAITGRAVNIETREERVELSYRLDNRWQSMIVKRSVAFAARNIVDLADKGLTVSSETARHLVRYFDDQFGLNLDALPVTSTVSHFGWLADGRFLPGGAEDVRLDFDDQGGTGAIARGYEAAGSLEDWIEQVARPVRKFPLARFQLAAGFGAPLLALLGHRVFIVHNWGPSGGGKTAGAYGAVSVWGDPETLKTSFNATRVGLENMAALYADLPLLIDERQVAGDRDDFVKSIVYMLGLGKSKARGMRGGGLQKFTTWRTITLSTGEQPLTTAGVEAGVKNRVLEIYGRPFGEDEDAARAMYDATDQYHGTAGPAFVARLAQMDREELRGQYQALRDSLLFARPDLQAAHVHAVAVVCMADYLYSQWLMDVPESAAMDDALALGDTILDKLESVDEVNDASRAMEYFASWCGINANFFEADPPGGRRYGITEQGAAGERIVCVYPPIFEDAMRAGGYNGQRILRDWADKGWILTETRPSDGKRRCKVRRQISGKREMFVAVIVDNM